MKKWSRRRWLAVGAGGVAAGALGYRLLRGFEDSPDDEYYRSLPQALRGPDGRGAGLDVHVHVMGTGASVDSAVGPTGCWMHPEMKSSIQARVGLWNLRLSIDQPDLDARYIDYLRARIRGAGFLKQAVILAMDYTYAPDGVRRDDRTPFYTPNDYVARLCRQFPEFLFGASVHPYRPDAIEALDRAAADGAVLVKWIPNVQAVDMADAQCRAFYRRLAEHKIALLPHVGDEQAMFVAGQEYGDPRRLVSALEEGVTVIAAHVASLGEIAGRAWLDVLCEMFPRWPNLYTDTSALTLITRWRRLKEVIARTEIHPRLVHGSDFPIPPASTLYAASMSPRKWWDAWVHENPLRRDFLVKQALGLPLDSCTRGYQVLAPRLPAP